MRLDKARNFDNWKLWICEVTGRDDEPDYVRYVEPHLYVVWNTVIATIHGKDTTEILGDVVQSIAISNNKLIAQILVFNFKITPYQPPFSTISENMTF